MAYKNETITVQTPTGLVLTGKLNWEKAKQYNWNSKDYIDVPFEFAEYGNVIPGNKDISPASFNLVIRKKKPSSYEGALRTSLGGAFVEDIVGNKSQKYLQSYQLISGEDANLWVSHNNQSVKTAFKSKLKATEFYAKKQELLKNVEKGGNTVERTVTPYECTDYIVTWYYTVCWDDPTYGSGNVTCKSVPVTEIILECTGGAEDGNSGGGGSGNSGKSVGTNGGNNYPPSQEPVEEVPCEDCLRIEKDTSISNNSLANCLYDALMDPNLENGLASILKALQGETGYNVTLELANIASEGLTFQTENASSKDIIMQIKRSNAIDPTYSRIYVAKTFIHEAFHAQLIQYSLKTFGAYTLSSWPKSTNDATLAELMDYVSKESEGNQTLTNATHSWMANHIDQLATSLRSFVQKYYPDKYNDPNIGTGLEAYRAMMYMGLQGTRFYNETVSSQQEDDFIKLRREFGYGVNGCPN